MPSHSTVRVGIVSVEGLLFASLFLFFLCCDKHDDFTHNSISCPRWAQNLVVAALDELRSAVSLLVLRSGETACLLLRFVTRPTGPTGERRLSLKGTARLQGNRTSVN